MHRDTTVIRGAGLADALRPSRWPARLDLAQSVSGLALALFMWVHTLFVSSILLGKDAMWTVTRALEGHYVFGESRPIITSVAVAAVMLLIGVHAVLALRKFPANYAEFSAFRHHQRVMRHADTTLWFWQLVTGFMLFFLAFIHLYPMLVNPDRIGPYESADSVWSDHLWPLYIVLLLSVQIHGAVGLYRLCMKWGWPAGSNPPAARRRLKILMWSVMVFLIALGGTSLGAYMKIGREHADRYGERYQPAPPAE